MFTRIGSSLLLYPLVITSIFCGATGPGSQINIYQLMLIIISDD
jgi:hypothetical protein